jgi:hypothetical protein
MKKISVLDRILLLITGLLAAYQIVVMEGNSPLATWSYTIAFGVLLVAGLLIIIMGFEVLDSPWVVIVSTIIPLSLSLGLVADYAASWTTPYLIFVIVGFLAIVFTRLAKPETKLATFTLAFVHGVAGLTIFLLPLFLAFGSTTPMGFALVGIGGALIGVGGLLLAFLKAGKPILPQNTILTVLPSLLLLMTICFVAGFHFA